MRSANRTVLLVAIAATTTLAMVAMASAAAIVKGGELALQPDAGTAEGLADMGIAVEATGKARFTEEGQLEFPLTGDGVGSAPEFRGIVSAAGGVLLSRADGASIKFKHLQLLIGSRKARVYVTVPPQGFYRLTSIKNYETSGNDEHFELKDGEANLSRPGAKLLSRTFDFPFRRGTPLGTMSIDANLTPVE